MQGRTTADAARTAIRATAWIGATAALLLAACGPGDAAQARPHAKDKAAAETAVSLPRHMGCFKDQSNGQSDLGGRDLNGAIVPQSQKMTVGMCASACKAKGFTYAGVQASSYCFCGDEYGRVGKAAACTSPCAGNPGQTCGGYFANDVYRVK